MQKLLTSLFAKLFSTTNTRYVNHFVPVEMHIPDGKDTLETEADRTTFAQIEKTIEDIAVLEGTYPVLKELNEVLVVIVQDLDNLRFTVEIDNGTPTTYVGVPKDKKATFILPLFAVNLEHLRTVISDGEITLDEAYRIVRVLFIPFLRGLYQGDFTHLPKDKAYLMLDNFLHVEVLPYNDVTVDGFPEPARASVVCVDGQWLVFEGFQGDPDIKYSMSLEQAMEFAYLIRVKLVGGSKTLSLTELKPVVERYNQLKNQVTVYEREWHTVSDIL